MRSSANSPFAHAVIDSLVAALTTFYNQPRTHQTLNVMTPHAVYAARLTPDLSKNRRVIKGRARRRLRPFYCYEQALN